MINTLFKFLLENNIAFAIINGYEDLHNYKSKDSDIDILFKEKQFKKIEGTIKLFCSKNNYLLVQIFHQDVWAKNIFIYDPKSRDLLNLDIYGELSRKKILFFNEESVFSNIESYNEIPILTAHQEFICYLFKKIDKKDLNKTNFLHLRNLFFQKQNECETILKENFSKTNQLIIQAFNENEIHLITSNYKLFFNDIILNKKFNLLNFFKNKIRTIKRILKPTGASIAFLGPDGSGKSTIIQTLIEQQLPYRRTDYFHLKPKHSKKFEGSVVVINPHEKKPYSTIKSFIKLMFFIFQYNFEWIKNILTLKTRSSLIIFDRYFDDILADPKRYRYGASKAIVKFAKIFIPKPDLYFILTTDPKVIFERKKEVSFTELESQVIAYKKLADGEKYFNIDVNRSPTKITEEVMEVIMIKMNSRYK